MTPGGVMPVPAGPTVGESLREVNFWPKRLAMMRIANTLGTGWLLATFM